MRSETVFHAGYADLRARRSSNCLGSWVAGVVMYINI